MAVRIQTPGIYLWIIRAISMLVPKESRREWRREWEAEIVSRWLLLKEWEKLDAHSKLDLFKRVQGAFSDVLWFQQSRTRMVLGAAVSMLFLISGIAMLRKWPSARRLVIITAILSILFHVYAALPPHRNLGPPALIIGAGYGLVLLIITLTSKGRKAELYIEQLKGG